MTVVTRFAPSPTGYLHIGGARTALFNWLYTKRLGGKFLLRIEDTDRARSSDAAVDAIIDGLSWLGLQWDGDPISQFARKDRHAEIAHAMLANGTAYKCYCSPDELEAMRAEQKEKGQLQKYNGYWRDRDPATAPAGIAPVIRLKAPQTGETILHDSVQGTVTVQNDQMDDLVLLRSDGTPTYLLAVVVDDYDMGITHVIRGDDHLTNTFRQIQIFQAMGWALPNFSHIPLIHGADGAKLSKRHGALGVDAYRDMGYLPEALLNYLLRLGWSHGDDEMISIEQAIEWFDLDGIGKSPSRLDFAKLDFINAHYLRQYDNTLLLHHIESRLITKYPVSLTDDLKNRVLVAMDELKQRAKTLNELAEQAAFLIAPRPLVLDEKAAASINGTAKIILQNFSSMLEKQNDFSIPALDDCLKSFVAEQNIKFPALGMPLRAALAGTTQAPALPAILAALGKDESRARIADCL